MTKVLIADDEPNILLSLDYLLRKNGYQVFIARDGAEALAVVSAEQPKIVLLDVMMPALDGYEVCRQIRAREDGQQYKIIFLSAKSREQDIAEGYRLGADFYFSKPFSTRQLLAKIQELSKD
jgi:DNA-binding response OmpR family regulator